MGKSNYLFQFSFITLVIVFFPWFTIIGYKYIFLLLYLPLFFYSNNKIQNNGIVIFYIFLLLYTLFIVINSGQTSVFLYSFTIIVLLQYASFQKYSNGFNFPQKKFILSTILLISIVLVNFTWGIYEKGRYGIYVEDANFSAMILFVMSFLYLVVTRFKIVPIVFVLIVITLTQSRMVALTLLIYFISNTLLRYKKLSLFFGYGLLFISVFGQSIADVIFNTYLTQHNIKTYSIFDRFSNINDTSNFDRIFIFMKTSKLLTSSVSNALFGVPGFDKFLIDWGMNVPHNWFIMMSALYGLIFSIIFLFSLTIIIKVQNKYTPLFYSIIFMAGFLNISLVMSPVLLTILFAIMTNDIVGKIDYKSKMYHVV